MKLEVLKGKERKRFMERLSSQYGIEEIPFLLSRSGDERIRMFSGSLPAGEMERISRMGIESMGLYLAKDQGGVIRLSFDAPLLLRGLMTKNIAEVSARQAAEWMKGNDIVLDGPAPKGYVVVKSGNDMLGCGKSLGAVIKNYVPMERRIKE